MKTLSKEETIIVAKIVLCKNNLRRLDYYTNKYVEGELSEERWREIVAQRKALRYEINVYEAQLAALKKEV